MWEQRCATCHRGKGESSSLQIHTTCNRRERKGKTRKGRKGIWDNRFVLGVYD